MFFVKRVFPVAVTVKFFNMFIDYAWLNIASGKLVWLDGTHTATKNQKWKYNTIVYVT